jgi:hypothetical protein
VAKAFAGEPAGLLQVGQTVWDVYYCHQGISQIDLSALPLNGEPASRAGTPATHGSLLAQGGDPDGWARNAAGRGLVTYVSEHL